MKRLLQLLLFIPALMAILQAMPAGAQVPAVDPNPAFFIHDGFEYDSIEDMRSRGGWGYECNMGSTAPSWTNCTTDLTSTPAHSGNTALRMIYQNACQVGGTPFSVFQGCHEGWNSAIARQFADVPEIFASAWVWYAKADPSKPSAMGNNNYSSAKQHYYNCCGMDPVMSVIGGFFNYGVCASAWCFGIQREGFSVQCPNDTGGVGRVDVTCTYPPNKATIAIPYGQWVCVEEQYKRNDIGSSNGVARIWINGTLTHEYLNLEYTRNPASAFRYVKLYRQAMDNTIRYEDDFAMATTRIGCGPIPPDPLPSTPGTGTGGGVPINYVDPDPAEGCPPVEDVEATAPIGGAAPLDFGPVCPNGYEVSGLPSGCSLSAGTFNPVTGIWDLNSGDASGLTVSCSPAFCGDIEFTVIPKNDP